MGKLKKSTALFIIFLIYLVSIGLSIWIVSHIYVEGIVKQVLLLDIVATFMVFGFSFLTKNSSVYDPYWSVIPPFIAGYLIWLNPEGDSIRQVIIFTLILFWAVRLTVNWARGWNGFKHEDWRYTKLAKDTGAWYWLVSFLGIHLMPTLLVFAGCLPLFYLLQNTTPYTLFELIAVLVTLGAILIEWKADEQLKKFNKLEVRKNYINTGLWSISRHPNYLGEITFWLGLFLFVPLTGASRSSLYTSVGFIAMILLFRFISIPLMEKRNLAKREGYTDYIKQTAMLFPVKRRFRN